MYSRIRLQVSICHIRLDLKRGLSMRTIGLTIPKVAVPPQPPKETPKKETVKKSK